jgi:hypothetical protein
VVSSLGSFLPEKYQPTTHKIEDVSKATAEAAATAAQSPPESAVFSLRRADEMSLEQWVRMEAKEPLILSGHPGTGKLTLVRQVIHTTGMEDVVHIDVKSMLEKKDDMMVCTVGSCWDCFSEGSCVCVRGSGSRACVVVRIFPRLPRRPNLFENHRPRHAWCVSRRVSRHGRQPSHSDSGADFKSFG